MMKSDEKVEKREVRRTERTERRVHSAPEAYPSIVPSRIDDPARIVVPSDQREPRDLFGNVARYPSIVPSRINPNLPRISYLNFSTRQNLRRFGGVRAASRNPEQGEGALFRRVQPPLAPFRYSI